MVKFNGNENFLGAGYWTWRADTANSVFGQFKGHNSGMHEEFGWLYSKTALGDEKEWQYKLRYNI